MAKSRQDYLRSSSRRRCLSGLHFLTIGLLGGLCLFIFYAGGGAGAISSNRNGEKINYADAIIEEAAPLESGGFDDRRDTGHTEFAGLAGESEERTNHRAATVAANERVEKIVLADSDCATPTVKKFLVAVNDNPRVQITNLKGSYGAARERDHANCAAVDISKILLPDKLGAKNYFESLDMVCNSYFNYSGMEAGINSENSHLHCYDKWWKEQQLDINKLARAVAWHETKDCTLGVGATHNNCFGFRRGGGFVRYDTVEESYADFKRTWQRYYKIFPTIKEARIYSGDDRAEDWLRNVEFKYSEG